MKKEAETQIFPFCNSSDTPITEESKKKEIIYAEQDSDYCEKKREEKELKRLQELEKR